MSFVGHMERKSIWMIGCWPVEMWRCGGGRGEVKGQENLECVNDDMELHGLQQCSGICGETSYRGRGANAQL